MLPKVVSMGEQAELCPEMDGFPRVPFPFEGGGFFMGSACARRTPIGKGNKMALSHWVFLGRGLCTTSLESGVPPSRKHVWEAGHDEPGTDRSSV